MAPEIERRRSNIFIFQNRRMKMKKKGKTALGARVTALCMAALMAVSMLPAQTVSAAETSFTKIAEEDFTTGRYVMVTDTGYTPQKFDNNWLGRYCGSSG